MSVEKFVMETYQSVMSEVVEKTSIKSNEYARGNDEFYNFKEGGKLTKLTCEQYLYALRAKHEVSIKTFIKDLTERGKIQPFDKWLEKITDSTLYMCILYAMAKKRLTFDDFSLSTVELNNIVKDILSHVKSYLDTRLNFDKKWELTVDTIDTVIKERNASENWLAEAIHDKPTKYSLKDWEDNIVKNITNLVHIFSIIRKKATELSLLKTTNDQPSQIETPSLKPHFKI